MSKFEGAVTEIYCNVLQSTCLDVLSLKHIKAYTKKTLLLFFCLSDNTFSSLVLETELQTSKLQGKHCQVSFITMVLCQFKIREKI